MVEFVCVCVMLMAMYVCLWTSVCDYCLYVVEFVCVCVMLMAMYVCLWTSVCDRCRVHNLYIIV